MTKGSRIVRGPFPFLGRAMDDEENVRERRFEVDQNFDGWRLDQFLANRIGRISRSRAGEIAKHGDVTIVPARKVKPSAKVRNGDVVIVREHLEPEIVQDDEVSILHRDDTIILIDKPAGMLVHETAKVRQNTVQAYLGRRGFVDAEPAHRIDRETSGIVVCAARAEVVPQLRAQFATTHPQKVYRALVDDPDELWAPGDARSFDTPMRVATETVLGIRMVPGDLSATTHVEVLSRRGRFADLCVVIETGRQHQIRAHLAWFGTPVAGDKLYTYDDDFFMAIHDSPDDPELTARLPFARHMLHAWRITLRHPDTGEDVVFEAPLPPGWR